MLFGNRNTVKKNKNVLIKFNNEELQTVSTFKHLGFVLDSVLSYNQHTNAITRNTCHKIYQLKRINPS